MGVRTTAPWEPACEALQARPKNTGAVGTVLTPEAGPGTAFHFLDGPHHRVANPSGKPLSGLGDASLHGTTVNDKSFGRLSYRIKEDLT